MKTITLKNEMTDLMTKEGDLIEVELQHEVGYIDRCKLYVHYNGETILRICKIKKEQIIIKKL